MKQLPKFKTLDEAGEFWDTHDFSDYWDNMSQVELSLAEPVKHYFLFEVDRNELRQLQELLSKEDMKLDEAFHKWLASSDSRL